jgi:hypothetical protein
MKLQIKRRSEVRPTARVKQMQGLFDVAPAAASEQSWTVSLDLPQSWNVGVIVGPSGAGKSTIARELFGDALVSGWTWPTDQSILDGFPRGMRIKDITGLLSSVGFSSPPAWVRPFHVLSNGQQFRVNLARTLAEKPELSVVDEFTSVVDRQVAQIGSAAVAKAVRARNQKFIAVTCHYDVLDWLEPDWIYEPHTSKFQAREPGRGPLRQRPKIELQIVRAHRSSWELFRKAHYLSGNLHSSAQCFVGLIEGTPATFTAVLQFPHATRPGWREHRTVCLPDFQGVGLGNAMSEFVASLFVTTKKPCFSTTSHPSMIRHRAKSPLWRMSRAPGIATPHHGNKTGMRETDSHCRLTASFEFVGSANVEAARGFGVAP